MNQPASAPVSQEDCRRLLNKIYSIPTENLDAQRIQWCMAQIQRLVPEFPSGRTEKGITICAGGRQRLLQAYAMISYIRKSLKCTLPIELVYVTDVEMKAPAIELFEKDLDVTCVDARVLIERYPYTAPKVLRGYMIKPFALLTSSFQEVILIDCDNIPVRDPSFLFEMQGYQDHGMVLWRDFPGLRDPTGQEKIFELLGTDPTTIPKHAHETGQIVVDTKRLWKSLHLNWFLNNNHEIFYKVGIHGETDLYQICINQAGESFFEMPYAPKTIGTHTKFAEGIHGHTLGQCDLEGDVLFAHRCCDDSYASAAGTLHGNSEVTTQSGETALPLAWEWMTPEAELPEIKVDANNKWILLPRAEPVAVPEILKTCYNHVCEVIEHLDANESHRFPAEAVKQRAPDPSAGIPANLQQQGRRLAELKERGFAFNQVIDVGACEGVWAKMANIVFPEADIFMIEANQTNQDKLSASGHPFEITLLGDADKDEVTFFLGDRASTEGCSMYREQTSYFFEEVTLPMKKLDTLLSQQGLSTTPVDLLKIDVQGAEIDVLKGATETLKSGPFVLLETQVLEYNKGAPMMADVISFMSSIGYQPCDVFEMHYLPNTQMLNQVDILFAPTGHAIFELPAHAESAIAPPEQTAILTKLIRALTQVAPNQCEVLVIDSPGHVVLGQYLEHGFKSQDMNVKRISLGEPMPECGAVYLMPGADTQEVLEEISKRNLLSVTGFPSLIENGQVALGLELNETHDIHVVAHAARLKATSLVLPEALRAIVRMIED
ncbi:MAG: FkbM family methyltransferase [Deltaproteobacteria bacterium]|nr:FkbM family methyltransferase [Deltaproteobacteria bacterium]